MSDRRPFLLFKDATDREQMFLLAPEATGATVGRQPSSDLLIDWDDQVSRVHARLERVGEDWEVIDDGLSRNGTFVNGRRLNGRHRLRDGDTVRFGGTTATFRSNGSGTPADVRLSTTQRRVLQALCRPFQGDTRFAKPASDEQIAEELFLSVGEVRTHLKVLYAKLGVPEREDRVHLVQRAFSAGLVSDR